MSDENRLSIRRAYEPAEVDLWADEDGGLFKTRRVTRSVQQDITAAEAKIDALEREVKKAITEGEPLDESAHEDKLAAAYGALLDARLEPADGSKPTKAKTPSAIVLRKWKANDLTAGELLGLVEQISEYDGRPT